MLLKQHKTPTMPHQYDTGTIVPYPNNKTLLRYHNSPTSILQNVRVCTICVYYTVHYKFDYKAIQESMTCDLVGHLLYVKSF